MAACDTGEVPQAATTTSWPAHTAQAQAQHHICSNKSLAAQRRVSLRLKTAALVHASLTTSSRLLHCLLCYSLTAQVETYSHGWGGLCISHTGAHDAD